MEQMNSFWQEFAKAPKTRVATSSLVRASAIMSARGLMVMWLAAGDRMEEATQ